MVITTVQKAVDFLSRDQSVIPSYFGGLLNYLEQVIKVFGFSFSLLRSRDNDHYSVRRIDLLTTLIMEIDSKSL